MGDLLGCISASHPSRHLVSLHRKLLLHCLLLYFLGIFSMENVPNILRCCVYLLGLEGALWHKIRHTQTNWAKNSWVTKHVLTCFYKHFSSELKVQMLKNISVQKKYAVTRLYAILMVSIFDFCLVSLGWNFWHISAHSSLIKLQM